MATQTPENHAGRLRVLTMLEDGKINAEECAELLDALSVQAPEPVARQRSQAWMMILAGAALVLVGFLLPWFGANLGQMLLDTSRNESLLYVIPCEEITRQRLIQAAKLEQHKIKESQYRLSFPGFMIKHGLGWGILALSLAAGFISLALTGIRAASQRNAALCLLALGAFMIFYLLFLAPRFVGFGLTLVVIGYQIETFGIIRRHQIAD